MKKGLLFLLLSMLTIGAWADDVAVADDISSYTGSATHVYNKADGKTYARNNLGEYELYGVYVKTNNTNVATAAYKVIDYIATDNDHLAYINTGYVHKANTRVVADVEITQAEGTADKWRAAFGSRKGGGGGATNGLVYFYHNGTSSRGMYKRNVTEYAGADQDPKTESVPINERITIDANGHTLSITKHDESEVYSTIKTPDDEELSEGVNPLFIFDLSSGDGTADGSKARMKLYSFKIYEGETLVRDYEPIVTPEGKGGLHDKVNGGVLFAAGSADFLLSPDAAEKLTPGISVYPGKMVYNTTDGKVYKYNGTDWDDLGARTLGSTIAGDYQNMNNWVTNDGHMGIFSDKWQTTTNGYKIDPYRGTGGHEPLMIQVPLEVGADYNYSFSASWSEYNSWHSTEMHAYVCNFWDLDTQESGTSVSNSVLATQIFPFAGGTDVSFSLDFTADRENQTLLFQFGDVNDYNNDTGANSFWFEFDNLSVKKYNYPEEYPEVNYYKPLLAELIAEVSDATLNTTNALSTAMSTALATANGVVDGDELAAQKTALDNLQAAYDNAKAVDVTILRATVTLAQDEGVDVTAANTFLDEGTTADALNSTLEALRMARKQAHFEKDNATYAGHEPFEGKFYLYNVGRKNYLSSGSNWGTHLALGWPGLELTATADGDGYKFQFQELNSGARDQMMTADYADGETGWAVTYVFEAISGKSGVYALKNGDNYLSFDPEATPDGTKYYNSVTSFISSKDSEDAQWIIVTKEDRLAQMGNATPANPVDATVLIKDASFNKYADLDTPWNDLNQSWEFGNREFGDKNTEKYWNEDGTYNLKQTITVPKAGKYVLKVQSYYRDGEINPHVERVQAEETLVEAANLYAQIGEDVTSTPIKYIHNEAGKSPGEGTVTAIGEFPNNMIQASKFFENGLYWNEIKFTVDEDNTEVTIGIQQGNGNRNGSWCVTDNFRLEYLGPTSESVTVTSAGYATYCSIRALDFSSTDIKAYVGTNEGDKLTFTPATQVPANTGLLLVYEGGKTEDVPVIASASEITGNCLVGVNEETTLDSNDYILNVVGGAGFYKAGSYTTLDAHKAYIPAKVGGAVKGFVISLDDDATAISSPFKGEEGRGSSIYNLAGQRLSKAQKGINIVNGKKVMVK